MSTITGFIGITDIGAIFVNLEHTISVSDNGTTQEHIDELFEICQEICEDEVETIYCIFDSKIDLDTCEIIISDGSYENGTERINDNAMYVYSEEYADFIASVSATLENGEEFFKDLNENYLSFDY